MNPLYRQVRFLQSASRLNQCPADTGREVAFAGRSNAGKSSAINAICDQKSLARTSSTPGRTQLLNFFAVSDEARLVDLPGYGYAKVSEAQKRDWQRHLAEYLNERQSLRGLVLVMDIRHPLKDYDQQMLTWCAKRGLDCHILLTKADKLSKTAAQKALEAVKSATGGQVTLQAFSAVKKEGIDEVHERLNDWLLSDQVLQ